MRSEFRVRRHLLTIDDLDRQEIEQVLNLTDSFAEIGERQIPKVPALRGKTIAWLFYEDSTRTRLSFETAAKRLSADTMNFSAGSSAVNKGESLRDTVETIEALGNDGIVVRHSCAGVPQRIADWIDAQTHDLTVPRLELRFHSGHVAQLRRADGCEVFRVREQHAPGVPDPFVELDAAFRGFRTKVGGLATDSKRHGPPPRVF